jgi:hypothetical protein
VRAIRILRAQRALLAAARPLKLTVRRHVNLSVHFRITGPGWAECRIADETSSCTVTASYLSDALRHLLLAATAVISDFSRVTFSFSEEPGEFRWVISRSRINEIELTILKFRELMGERPDSQGAPLFSTKCLPRTFAKAIDGAARELVASVGESGYAEQWSRHPFPSLQLQELGRLLDIGEGAW